MQINTSVNSVTLSNDNTYSILLHQGWNIISSPFNTTTQWDAVKAANPNLAANQILYNWTGSNYTYPNVMTPYVGYYFNNTNNLASLKIPYDAFGSLGKTNDSQSYPVPVDGFLKAAISSQNSNGETAVFIGFNKNSKNEIDENDYYMPPSDFESAEIMLVRNELPKRERYLLIEQRPEIGEGQEYDLEIKTQPNTLVRLNVQGMDNFNGYEIYLVNTELNNVYNLRNKNDISFTSFNGYNYFKLYIGNKEYVEKLNSGILPSSYSLSQNFPNPFNPATVIRFSLPERTSVSLKVFSVLGEIVGELISNRIYDAGNYDVQFNGAGLTSGIYFYKLETENYSDTKKMIYLK